MCLVGVGDAVWFLCACSHGHGCGFGSLGHNSNRRPLTADFFGATLCTRQQDLKIGLQYCVAVSPHTKYCESRCRNSDLYVVGDIKVGRGLQSA